MGTNAKIARRAADAQRALMSVVASRDGVAHTPRLIAEGHSRHRIARAVDEGALVRVAPGWVALPRADAQLIEAARRRVVITCITQASRLGLWVLEENRLHVGVDAHARVSVPGARLHWAAPLVQRTPDALVDPIENVLALVAACQPHDEALAVFESALRKGLVTTVVLGRMPLSTAARGLLDEASAYSDSGLETIFVTRLRWLRVRILQQIWISGHHVDILLGERLVVQADGGHHIGEQRTSDNWHDAQLRLLGYHVLRFGYAQIIGDWPRVQDLIMRAVAQGLHLRG